MIHERQRGEDEKVEIETYWNKTSIPYRHFSLAIIVTN